MPATNKCEAGLTCRHPQRGQTYDEWRYNPARSPVVHRQLRRMLHSAILGVLLASLVGGVAMAQILDGNSACAHFCEMVFPPGPERGTCVSAAAHGAGPCFQCGPAAPSSLHCELCGLECCAAGEVCDNGQCTLPPPSAPGCPNVEDVTACLVPDVLVQGCPCQQDPDGTGFCYITTEATVICSPTKAITCGEQICADSSECPPGTACVQVPLCCGVPKQQLCLPTCQ